MRCTLTALALSALAALGTAHGATVYASLAAWQAAVSGPVQTQDFSGYAVNQNLLGEELLPGTTLTTNMGRLIGFRDTDRVAFGLDGRQSGNAYYEGQYTLPYLATAFDIISFEAGGNDGAVDQGLLTFLFSDGTSQSLNISGGDGSPIFVGIVSDVSIVSFHWNEAHEANGGNEETAIDNLRVAMLGAVNQLPLPGTLSLALLALGVVPMVRRR